MTRRIDLTGKRFGELVALAIAADRPVRWLCRCDCGNETVVRASYLRGNHTRSCGCRRARTIAAIGRETGIIHGQWKTPEFAAWGAMLQRCYNPRNKRFANYGGRGITVCDDWRTSFVAFIRDMGQRPSTMHSIDRIDNDGNYTPANCRWATRIEQRRNQSRFIARHGVSVPRTR